MKRKWSLPEKLNLPKFMKLRLINLGESLQEEDPGYFRIVRNEDLSKVDGEPTRCLGCFYKNSGHILPCTPDG